MAKSTRKRAKGTTLVKKAKKTTKARTGTAEKIKCLLELHELQGLLLNQLAKEI